MNPARSNHKKILLISSVVSMFYRPTFLALQKLGFEVRFVDDRGTEVLRNSSLIHKVVNHLPIFAKSYLLNKSYGRIDSEILRVAKEFKPDYVIALKAKYIGLDVLDKLRTMTTTINWYPESTNNIASINRIVRHYDYFFEFDKSIVDLLKNQGHTNVYYLPFCGDIEKDAEWSDIKKDLDVIFLGSYQPNLYPQRPKILEQIKDLGLTVYGNRAWLDTSLKNVFRGSITSSTQEIKKLYNKAKIVIHMDALTTHSGTGLTMRPFDVASVGSMLLAQDDRVEIFDFFEDGKEFVSFHGPEDIREKVQYYLTHDEERKRIARAGFEKVRSRHTYLDRMKEMFSIISN